MRALVVYYSRSGNTRGVALEIARALGADVEELSDGANRRGPVGYLRCCYDAVTGAVAELRPTTRDLRDYDLVVVGGPTWASTVSSPVRAYLHRVRGELPAVAFFRTMGGSGGERVFHEMAAASKRQPAATLAVRAADVASHATHIAIARFATLAKFGVDGAPARDASAG